MTVSLVAAMSRNRVIGRKGDLPWQKLRRDKEYLKSLTRGHPVIMGRATYESLPPKWRPLPERSNIVLTRDADYVAPGALVSHSLEAALDLAAQEPGSSEVFILGGGQVYQQALPLADRVHLTAVETYISDGDAFFPEINPEEWQRREQSSFVADADNEYGGTFYVYTRQAKA